MDLAKLRGQAYMKAFNAGYPEIADDFAQEAIIALHGGRKAKLGQLFVDFLRSEYGHTRYTKGEETERHAEKAGYLELDPNRTVNPEAQDNLDFRALIKDLEPQERAYLVLRYEWGLGLREIAECFGVTEGRVCQEMKDIHQKVKRIYMRSMQ